MIQIINLLIALFSSVGPIAKFFLWIGKKVALTAVILPIQIAFIGSIIVFRLSLVVSFTTLIIFIYNKFTDLISFIGFQISSGYFTIPFNILESMGVISALSDVFAYFTIIFTTLFISILSKVAVNSLRELSDEFYKIGVLLQLGIK